MGLSETSVIVGLLRTSMRAVHASRIDNKGVRNIIRRD